MKAAIVIYAILFILMATGCQPGSQEAVVGGVNATCVNNPSACNSSVYQQSNGYTAYTNNNGNPFTYHNNSPYLCSCPAGTIPTYNSYSGLGCVYNSYYNYTLYSGYYSYYFLGWGQASWYQMSYISSFNYGSSSCYSGAVQSCYVERSTCPAGYSCRQNSSNSNLGLCVTSYR